MADCLARYPEHAEELRPLLNLASAVKAVPTPRPDPATVRANRQRMLGAVQAAAACRQRRGPAAFAWFWRISSGLRVRPMLQAALALAAAVVLVSLASGVLFASAADSLPGQALYPVKRFGENVRLSLTLSPAARQELQTEYVLERRREVRQVLDAGQPAALEFRGELEEIGDDYWIIGGLRVMLDGDGFVEGHVAVGAMVIVRASSSGDGTLRALKLQVLTNPLLSTSVVPATPTPTPTMTQAPTAASTPTPTMTQAPTTAPTATPTVTQTPSPMPTETPTPVPTATSAPTHTEEPEPTNPPEENETEEPESTDDPDPTDTEEPDSADECEPTETEESDSTDQPDPDGTEEPDWLRPSPPPPPPPPPKNLTQLHESAQIHCSACIPPRLKNPSQTAKSLARLPRYLNPSRLRAWALPQSPALTRLQNSRALISPPLPKPEARVATRRRSRALQAYPSPSRPTVGSASPAAWQAESLVDTFVRPTYNGRIMLTRSPRQHDRAQLSSPISEWRALSASRVCAAMLEHCELCPHCCGVNRLAGEQGICRMGDLPKVSSWNIHRWEEPPLSGTRGSGTIFFSGCTGRCRFCQNYPISQLGHGDLVEAQRLASMMLELQRKGAHNINLVTPTHFVPQILAALFHAVRGGLRLPLVYNTSGYEREVTLSLLEDIVDIWLPDAKYGDDATARRFSGFKDYVASNRAALREMYRQEATPMLNRTGCRARHDRPSPGAARGTCRHGAGACLDRHPPLAGDSLSLMDQYFPAYRAWTIRSWVARLRQVSTWQHSTHLTWQDWSGDGSRIPRTSRTLARCSALGQVRQLVRPPKKKEVTWSPPGCPLRFARSSRTPSRHLVIALPSVSLTTSEPSDAITWIFHPPSRSE